MIITSCGNSIGIAKSLAKKLKAKYSPLTISSFPDDDIYLRFNTNLKGKKLIIMQSFQPHPNQSLLRILFAAETAKDLGAKKVVLVAPYLAYMRQDKRFHPGEAISNLILAKLLSNSVDKIVTIDPHLHRYRKMSELFQIPAKSLTANDFIASYINRKFDLKRTVLVGPDWESSQWAGKIAKQIGSASTVLEKKRYSSRRVKVKITDPIAVKGRDAVIVDDIISTGHTMVEAAKELKRRGASSVSAIAVHGLFVEDALKKLKKAGVKRIITTNCVEHKTNKIDVSSLLAEELKSHKSVGVRKRKM